MRLANRHGRAHIVLEDGFVDVATASAGRFSSRLDDLLTRLEELGEWWGESRATHSVDRVDDPARDAGLGPVVAAPSQIFAVGLNYHEHAREMGLPSPSTPMVFTKFSSSLAGTGSLIPRVSDTVDWESELVVVIGTGGRDLKGEAALEAIAGYCVGQDISDRDLQMAATPPQFSLGKSWPNFTVIGPWLTTRDEISDPQSLGVRCDVSEVTFQNSSTKDMVFSVVEIVEYLSRVVELRSGDLIFTGSPEGVGQGQKPPRFLEVGDEVVTRIDGLGTLFNRVVEPSSK